MRFGCCINLGSFVPQVAGEAKAQTTADAVGESLRFLSDVGYDFAEFTVGLAMNPPQGDFEALLEAVSTAKLPVYAFNSFIPPSLPLIGPARDLKALEKYVKEACSRIARLGGRVIVLGSGAARRAPEGLSSEETRKHLMEFLTLAGQHASPYGITIVLEPLNKKETNLIHLVSDAVRVVQELNMDNVRALADTYHMEMEGESPEVLADLGAFLSHVHVADTDRRAPGTGDYDYDLLRECLEAGGYSGGISVECKWEDFKAEAPIALRTLRQAWS
ncbi:MAG: sugar phosphate isomerase/epimerase [Firmicutes bacterium]|nr:sugar phosphate isomerase/epimerase [Bacillota bacterium]